MSEKREKDVVNEYVASMIIGLVLLYALWGVVVALTADLPQIYKNWIAIGAVAIPVGNVIRNKIADARMMRTFREAGIDV